MRVVQIVIDPPRILVRAIVRGVFERILEDVDALLTNISAAWFFSGDLFSGEV